MLFKADKEKKRPFFYIVFYSFFWFTFLLQRGEFTSRWHHSPFMHTPPFTSAWWQICRKTWRSISSSLNKIKSRFAFTSSNSLHQSEKRENLSFCCYLKVYCFYQVSVESFNWPFLYKQHFSKYLKQSFSVFWSCLLNSMLLVQVAAKQQKKQSVAAIRLAVKVFFTFNWTASFLIQYFLILARKPDHSLKKRSCFSRCFAGLLVQLASDDTLTLFMH